MNLFLISTFSGTALKLEAKQLIWDRLGIYSEIVFYEPSEEAHAFIGHCLMMNITIKFQSLAEPVEITEGTKVYAMCRHPPDIETTLNGRLISLTNRHTCPVCSDKPYSCCGN